MAPTSSEWLVFSQWLRRSIEPSGSTRTSAMFWTSRISSGPRRTSRSGLYAAERTSVGSNSRQYENRDRQPAIKVQFSPLMSCTTTEEGQESSVGTTSPTPLPLRVGAKHSTCSGPACRR